MDRDSAMALIGTRRVHPVTLSRKYKLPIPGSGGTVHECVRIEGSCTLSTEGFQEHYARAWITACREGELMWTGADDFATWPLEVTTDRRMDGGGS